MEGWLKIAPGGDEPGRERSEDRHVNHPASPGVIVNIAKASFLAAPALMAGYGVVRLTDSEHGPGFVWTFGHLLMLAGLVMFGWVFAGLRRAVPGRTAKAFGAIGFVGLGAVIVQICVDIVVGFMSSDAATKDHNFERFQEIPGVLPVVYTVVPLFFYVGLLALTTLGAVVRPRSLPWWTPVLILVGTAVAGVNLDYIPEAGVLYLIAFLPLVLRTTRTAPVGA
ncbi:hypothetical protein [Dactylosporangium sp. NPDC048998]|uniref:hypothetical protein n=1 Tax=Dactylosporangium sp. NPDC048998 TaxID=3363976 RepID=UPI003714410A